MLKLMYKHKFAIVISVLFFIAYATLSIVRHLHFESYGFDLGIADQIVWKYSQFLAPITTVQHYPFTSLLTDHVELIYILLSPFYWIYASPITLLILQAVLVAASGIPVYLLAKRYKLVESLSLVIMVAYLSFYGIQNAIWFDVHSIAFGAAFIPWFIYFLDSKNKILATIMLLLAIISKEDVAMLTLLISAVFFFKQKTKLPLILGLVSLLYLILVFFVYFPHFTHDGYRYANPHGMLSDIQIQYLYDTQEKREVYLNSLSWFGFLSLLSPVYLLPALGDVVHYFVLGNHLQGTHGLYLHYRITLAILLVWPFIMTMYRYKKLNNKFIAILLLLIVAGMQYHLHVPLTYLSKSWFWKTTVNTNNINSVISQIPKDASVVAQNNLTPHLAERKEIFTLWPEKRKAAKQITCGSATCNWFRWAGNPQYLLIDSSSNWDIRHLLTQREDYFNGLANMEKSGLIKKDKQVGTTTLYRINPINK